VHKYRNPLKIRFIGILKRPVNHDAAGFTQNKP